MNIDLVIFDCDGVLIDSEIIACRIDAEVLTALGMPMTTEQVIRRFSGVSQKDVQAAVEREIGRPLPAGHEARVVGLVEEAMARELRAIPGAGDLPARLGVPYCIASSSTPERLRFSLTLTDLYDVFAPNIFSSTDVARGKPAPDLFLHAASRMNARPDHCLVVEDSLPGIRAACAAGMYPVGFVGAGHCDDRHRDRLRQAGAGQVIDTLEELAAVMAA